MEIKDIEKLAQLARIDLTNDEKSALLEDVEAILGYVGEIQSLDVPMEKTTEVKPPYNVMREDREPHESGLYTKELLESAPGTERNYIKVKKIL